MTDILTNLTYPINAHASFVVRARRPILDFAGHSEEKIKVLSNAVQLADVLF